MTARESNLDEARRTEAARTMLDFWRCVWDRRSFWIEERAALLRPLMERLEQLLAPVTALASEKEKKTADNGIHRYPVASQNSRKSSSTNGSTFFPPKTPTCTRSNFISPILPTKRSSHAEGSPSKPRATTLWSNFPFPG